MLYILVYHLWTFIGNSSIEAFIIRIGFIGVDIFFFLSAYSMSGKEISYKKSLIRAGLIYVKFFVFAVIYALYNSISFSDFVKTVTGLDLFLSGGGSFLWFAPAFIIFTLLFPLFCRSKFKYKWAVLLGVWFTVGILISQLTAYKAIFIVVNRIPVILAGYYAKKLPATNKKKTALIGSALTITGIAILYFFYFKLRINEPVTDIFYITGIPLCLGLAMLSGLMKESKVLRFLSTFTFELYAVQMIVGFDLAVLFYDLTELPVITNILTFISVLAISYIAYLLLSLLLSVPERIKERIKTGPPANA